VPSSKQVVWTALIALAVNIAVAKYTATKA
jgi:hypothetical protein